MYTDLSNLFKSLAPFSDGELSEALGLFKPETIRKNDLFSREKHYCNKIAFVRSGLLRSFYTIKDKETTTFFLVPGSIAVALQSFIKQLPAIENIQAIMDSELLTISRNDLYGLYQENWKWQQVGRKVIEESYLNMEMRSITLQSQSAAERYKNFAAQYNDVLKTVPLLYIASYLGISPETLSRIRNMK